MTPVHSFIFQEKELHDFPPYPSKFHSKVFPMGTPNKSLDTWDVEFWDMVEIDLYDCYLSQ